MQRIQVRHNAFTPTLFCECKVNINYLHVMHDLFRVVLRL